MKKIIAALMALSILVGNTAFAAGDGLAADTEVEVLRPGDEYREDLVGGGETEEKPVYAESAGSVYYSDIEDYSVVGILGALNIIGASEGTLFKPNTYISRGEFVETLLRLLNIDYSDTEGLSVGEFYDVDKENPWYNVVYNALAVGLVSGYTDNSFRPDSVMSYQEAKICLVRALGYDQMFGSYEKIATDIGITDGVRVKNAKAITRMEMAELIYNTLKTPTKEMKFQDGNQAYTLTGKTILYDIWEIEEGAGNVTSSFSETFGSMTPERGTVVINDSKKYKTENAQDQYMIGLDVNYYYDENDNLIYMHRSKKVEEIVIDSDNFLKYENNAIEYYDGSKRKSKKLESGFRLLYNGVIPTGNFTYEELFAVGEGEIRLISNDGGSSYDMVMIEEYRNYITSGATVKGMKVSLLLKGNNVELDAQDTNIIIFDENRSEKEVYRKTDAGEDVVDVSAIKAGSVVSIFTEYDGYENGYPKGDARLVKIIVSGKTVTGKVGSVDRDELEVEIGEEVYGIATYIDDGGIRQPLISVDSFVFNHEKEYQLDYRNKLVAETEKSDTGEWEYVYLMRVRVNPDTECVEKIRVFETSENAVEYKISEKLRKNGKKAKLEELDDDLKASAALVNRSISGTDAVSKTYGQLLKIKKDGDTIIEMETLVASEGDPDGYANTQLSRDPKYTKDDSTKFSVMQDYEGVTTCAAYTGGVRGAGVFIPATTMFHVPLIDSNNIDDYSSEVVKSTRENMIIDFYDVDDQRPACAVVYTNTVDVKYIRTGYEANTWAMFNSAKQTLNEDDEVVTEIVVTQYNGDVTYWTVDEDVIDELAQLEKGSLLRLKGLRDEVREIEVAYHPGNGKPIGPSNLPWDCLESGSEVSGMQATAEIKCTFYEVYDKYTATLCGLQNKGLKSDGVARDNLVLGWYRGKASMKGGMIIYTAGETERDSTTTVGNFEKMRTVVDNGKDKCSVVFAFNRGGSSVQYIVYNLNSNLAARSAQQ